THSAVAARRSAVLHRSLNKAYPVAVRGDGVWLYDAEGRKLLDFASSAVVNFIGHGDAGIVRAMTEQAAQLEFAHSSRFTTDVAEQFARELLEFAGPAFRDGAVFFTSGGSESVESALKLARQYQVESGHAERYQVVSRRQSYHGATIGAMAVSGNEARRSIYLPMLREFPKAGIPYCYRCRYDCSNGCADCGLKYAAEVERAIAETQGTAAAFIMEPVSGATLGAAAPPPSYVKRVAEICHEQQILLIADEVMTGFGRTGRRFAMDHFEVAPDLIAAGKGISSGYVPLGAVIAQRHVVDAIANGTSTLLHGFTYNGHPVCVAAGRAVLKRVLEGGLVEAADSAVSGSVASVLRDELQQLWKLDCVGDVRGLGLLWAVEFVADKRTKDPYPAEKKFAASVTECAMKRGVVLYPMQGCVDGKRGDHVMIAPPAVITAEEVRWAVEQVREAIEETRIPG
ncbi:MAG TPA: aspartate aminotransferase family protein, partial [Bryobacteraceae bacterium]|nr:aspartate aminotransferase family protein [Bryobacteraceae bacterium]